jgi:predicted PurR-regulated permease PerM
MHAALWIGLLAAALWLLALLSPILTPFLIAGILAYLCNPAVGRMRRAGLPLLAAVLAILLLAGLLSIALALILAPLLVEETAALSARVPDALAFANDRLAPWFRETFGIRLALDAESVRALAGEHADSLQAIARKLYESLKIGGLAVLGFAIGLLLVPVVMFYLLLDWANLLARAEGALPRPWHDRATRLARDVDAVLSEFLRGQLSVMLILAAYYGIALWLAGIPYALAIGLLTGLLVFIPYLGFATGLFLALLVAALQFEGMGPVLAVLAVFGIGQLLESFLLTPFLVGNRIGLHPLAVIFALMAFGQLFGFFGILLALPASAALLVGLRELRAVYLSSRFYKGDGG